MRHVLLVLVIAAAACGGEPAAPPAAQGAASDAAAIAVPEAGEHLLAAAPDGWQQIFHADRPGTRLVEYVPPGSPADDWTEKVAFESFSGDPLPHPTVMLDGLARDQALTCERFSDHATFDGVENGYPTAVRLLVCPLNPLTRAGQVTLVKAIRGDEHFYVVSRAVRVPPIPAEGDTPLPPKTMAEWSLYLRAISLCAPDSTEHPCPEGASPSGAGAIEGAAEG
jgi:hypothetical protein